MEALWAFLGGLVGGLIPAVVAWRSMRQAGRVEWRHRLDWAIVALRSPDRARREMGRVMLADLMTSSLGTAEEHSLAVDIANAESTVALDEPTGEEDNDGEGREEDA